MTTRLKLFFADQLQTQMKDIEKVFTVWLKVPYLVDESWSKFSKIFGGKKFCRHLKGDKKLVFKSFYSTLKVNLFKDTKKSVKR